jgi:hypothetical protein
MSGKNGSSLSVSTANPAETKHAEFGIWYLLMLSLHKKCKVPLYVMTTYWEE